MWLLLSREISNTFKAGAFSKEDLTLLAEAYRTAKSRKFLITSECAKLLGFEQIVEDTNRENAYHSKI